MIQGFEKTADDGWGSVQSLLSLLPKADKAKAGDKVVYTDRIKWTNEPDGKHTKGGGDFKKHGIRIGDRGTVKKVDRQGVHVSWDLHELYPETKGKTWSYQHHNLRLANPVGDAKDGAGVIGGKPEASIASDASDYTGKRD